VDLQTAAHPLLVVLAAALCGAFAWWSYGRTTPVVTGWRRPLLAGLRAATLFVVFLLLFEPVLRRVLERADEPVVAVLVDVSRSIAADPQAQASGAADRLRDAVAALPRDANTRYYTFSTTPEATPGRPDNLRFDGERTDIGAALERAGRDLGGRNLRAVLLLSDGRFTAGRNPVWVAARYPVPVYTALVGDSASLRDVRVTDVLTNDVAYVGAEVPVRVAIGATGFAGERASVTLSEGGRTIATTEVVLPADGGEAAVELAVTPASPGLKRWTASVSRRPGEATYRNNTQSVAVRVIDQKRRLLVLAAAPSPDLAALRAVLDADDQIEATYRTQRAPGQFYEGALPETLDRAPAAGGFDLLVLVGYPGAAADAGQAARIAAAIDAGRPALFVLTRQTDMAALARHFNGRLPAVPEVPRPGFVEAGLALTRAAASHPVLEVPGGAPAAFTQLPPLEASESRWALAPGARVLATARRGGVDTGAPLLVLRQEGGARSAALLGAASWRWRTLPADLDALAPLYPGLVDNLVRWTTTREDRRPVRVRPTRPAFGPGERVRFVGQVYDEALRPVADAEVRVTVSGPGGRAVRTMQALGSGRYALDLAPLAAGAYTFEAVAARGGARIGDDRGAFAVGALAVEFQHPGADPALMRQVALRSGGAVVPLDEVGSFHDRLRRDGRMAPRPVEVARETPLLDLPLLLGLLIAALTAEWVLRKRNGLV